MVVDDAADGDLNRLFHALADPTRRDVLRRCVSGGLSVSRLADEYAMSFAAVQKHVTVLERAGLVSKRRRGREQLVRTEPAAVTRARQALDELEDLWRGRVDRMSSLLAPEPHAPEQETGREPGRQQDQEPGRAHTPRTPRTPRKGPER
ncbi:ArsR/SmtB family transcription factor [Streptomyces sp. NPDC014882]|uniref:ArsR/SmtB family transcription factor n=1 Tax=Streptomyces sp. NPDC014882 TaxID=3364927 RepID=UPI003701E80A